MVGVITIILRRNPSSLGKSLVLTSNTAHINCKATLSWFDLEPGVPLTLNNKMRTNLRGLGAVLTAQTRSS